MVIKVMKFTKMQGCGNDYVYVNGFVEKLEMQAKPDIVRRLSDRHFGIGGDGVIFINPSKIADFEMEMWNADGTRAQMCGNGIRCVAKYVYDYGLTDKTSLTIESFGKIKYIDLTLENGKVSQVKVNMGAPILAAREVPVVSEYPAFPWEILMRLFLWMTLRTWKLRKSVLTLKIMNVFRKEQIQSLSKSLIEIQ